MTDVLGHSSNRTRVPSSLSQTTWILKWTQKEQRMVGKMNEIVFEVIIHTSHTYIYKYALISGR